MPSTPYFGIDGEIMPQSFKRKAMEAECDVSENPLHFYEQRIYLLRLTVAKYKASFGDPRPKRKGEKRKGPDYRRRALLRSTMIRYQKQRMEEEEAEKMSQNDSPLHETSWDDTPGSCTPGATEMFMESGNVSPSTSNAGASSYSASLFSEQPARQRPQEVPGCRPFSSDFNEVLDDIEDLLMNPGEAPEQCLEEEASPVADDGLFGSSAEDLIPTFQMETSVSDCFAPGEPLNDPLPGILEDLATNYLGDLPVDEIDAMEFETIPALLQPGEEETTPVYPEEEASENFLHFSPLDGSGIEDLEEFAMAVLTSD